MYISKNFGVILKATDTRATPDLRLERIKVVSDFSKSPAGQWQNWCHVSIPGFSWSRKNGVKTLSRSGGPSDYWHQFPGQTITTSQKTSSLGVCGCRGHISAQIVGVGVTYVLLGGCKGHISTLSVGVVDMHLGLKWV